MKIYLPEVLEGQEWIMPRQMEDHEVLQRLSGRMQPQWRPLQMDILRKDDKGNRRRYSDFPWYGGHVLIMKSRAVRLLRPILEQAGEFLPLQSDEDVSLFNVTTIVDALDEGRSEIVRFDDDGSIMLIDKHVLRPEAIGDVEMFRLPHHVKRLSGIYMRETMVHRIAELGLEGVAFKLIWSDEPVSEKEVLIEIGKPRRPSVLKRLFGQRHSIDWRGWLGRALSGPRDGTAQPRAQPIPTAMSELEALLARMPAMKRRFETACASYPDLAAHAASRVASRQWSVKPLYSPYPFGIERVWREPPGKPMKAAPRRIAKKFCYGLADDGSVVLVYDFVSEEGQRYEEYWEHRSDGIDTTLFDYYEPASNVLNVQRVDFLDGRPATFLRYARYGVTAEVYRYTDGRLSQIDGASKEHAAVAPVFTTDQLHYQDGQLESVVRTWVESGLSECIYPTSGR